MCNVNVVNSISCFCFIIFYRRLGVVLATLATPWLGPCRADNTADDVNRLRVSTDSRRESLVSKRSVNARDEEYQQVFDDATRRDCPNSTELLSTTTTTTTTTRVIISIVISIAVNEEFAVFAISFGRIPDVNGRRPPASRGAGR